MGLELGRRFARIKHEWPQGATLICEVVMFFIGLALLVASLTALPVIPNNSPWQRWGDPGEIVIGIAFVLLGAYGALFRERQTGLIPTFLLVCVGITTSVHPFNVIGFIFYSTFLIGGIADANIRYERARLIHEREDALHAEEDE